MNKENFQSDFQQIIIETIKERDLKKDYNSPINLIQERGSARFHKGLFNQELYSSTENPTPTLSPEDRLATRNAVLQAEVERLKARNTYLETTAGQTETRLDQVRGEVERLKALNQRLGIDNSQLASMAEYWKKQAEMAAATAKTSGTDSLDPKGHYRALGIDPALARHLSIDAFDSVLRYAFRAYSVMTHPESGGTTDAMKRVNEAHDFLKNPQKRKSYGS